MRGGLRIIVVSGGLATIALGVAGFAYHAMQRKSSVSRSSSRSPTQSSFRHQNFGNYTLWWDEIPAEVRWDGCPTGPETNIHPRDYAGPDACKNCHKKQYETWSKHPHRWMNALAGNTTIHGDFNHRRMSYLGGEVTFYKAANSCRMRLERGGVRREYVVEQTIGSRYFQYYVGRQLEGPEPSDHPLYSEAHVLPLGYWLDRQEWVPTVHVGVELREAERHDPFAPRPPHARDFGDYADQTNDLYRSQCNVCHTTFAIGDMFLRFQPTLGRHIPTLVDVSLADYVQSARPELWPAGRTPSDMSNDEFAMILREFYRFDAREHAVTLGISCEACHLGAKDHAEGTLDRPKFFPRGPEVIIRSQTSDYDLGRTHDNVNWACGRCHAGDRPQYANGSATWNSTEYTDAMRGGCYSQLTCTRCHDPHESIGHEWSHTPAEDDAVCLSCHQKFEHEPARAAHTHHSLNHDGSRCMNCHMPRINEGLQEVVRTHTIFSPTDRSMIEMNHMNACNLCHVERPIDWTLTHLKNWYGKTFREGKIDANYPHRDGPAAIGWLKSDNESVRLVAADALARGEARWALPELILALDDPFLLNRQFARIGLEKMLTVKLSEFGYQFYQTREERALPLQKLREHLLPDKVEVKSSGR
jgi:predicted CXXCH cytochrome family protein